MKRKDHRSHNTVFSFLPQDQINTIDPILAPDDGTVVDTFPGTIQYSQSQIDAMDCSAVQTEIYRIANLSTASFTPDEKVQFDNYKSALEARKSTACVLTNPNNAVDLDSTPQTPDTSGMPTDVGPTETTPGTNNNNNNQTTIITPGGVGGIGGFGGAGGGGGSTAKAATNNKKKTWLLLFLGFVGLLAIAGKNKKS